MYGHRIALRRMHDDTSCCGVRGHVSLSISQWGLVGGLIVEHSLGDLGRSLVLPASRQHLWPHVMRLRHRRLRIGRPGMLARIGARRRVDREEIGMDKHA